MEQDFLKKISERGVKTRIKNGFYTPTKLTGEPGTVYTPGADGNSGMFSPVNPSDGDLMLGKLMLVVTEISEAAEAVRKNDLANFGEEIADAYIRLSEIVGTMEIDIQSIIEAKMDKNESRPFKHGKLTIL
jgi:hypothetical protein